MTQIIFQANLDENNCRLNQRTTEYCYGLRRILQFQTDK